MGELRRGALRPRQIKGSFATRTVSSLLLRRDARAAER